MEQDEGEGEEVVWDEDLKICIRELVYGYNLNCSCRVLSVLV